MSLRTQLAMLTAASVAAAVVVVSLVVYIATQDRLRAPIDDNLRARAEQVAHAPGLPRRGPGGGDDRDFSRDPFAETDSFFQVVGANGAVLAAPVYQQLRIPVEDGDLAVAAGTRDSFIRDAHADGVHLRVITSAGDPGEAVQIARSLEEVDASLSGLRKILFGVSGAGIALAAVLGLIVAERSLRPIARLTAAAEHVAATQELDANIDVRRHDEIGRLARSVSEMLAALQESRQQQRQLVMDASHELRTPLTSLRTNIDVLTGAHDLGERDRRELLRDVRFELEELTKIVQELVELAAEGRPDAQAFEDVRLDQLARVVVERAARRSELAIELDAVPALVVGSYALLERAASNLVDNAAKWSPMDARIEVRVRGGTFTVRDRGAGIADSDRPHVFDRFYRGEAARSKPGSGLGLAIVKQIVEAHNGRAWVEAADGGGTIAGFELTPVPLEARQQRVTREMPATG